MNNFVKILISLFILTLVIIGGNYVFAGKGFFYEKDNQFYIFDNVYINGYLSLGENIIGSDGAFGDVLVEGDMFLDSDSSFFFCLDERQAFSNLPLNTDCEDKVLIWDNTGNLIAPNEIPDDQKLYQMRTDRIQMGLGAGNSITFSPIPGGSVVYTDENVKVVGTGSDCVTLDGTGDCNDGEIRTNRAYFDTLDDYRSETDHQNVTDDNLIEVKSNIDFDKIFLTSLADQDLCWEQNEGTGCGSANGGDDSGDFTDMNFYGEGCTGSCVRNNELCCYLDISL